MSWRHDSVDKPLEKKDIEDALSYADTEVLEFFPEFPDEPFSLLKTIVEFANHEGGTIFLGIGDSDDYVGVDDVESVKEDVGMHMEDRVEGDLTYYIFEHEIESVDIIEIRIEEFSSLPCAVDGKFYKWKPIQSRPLSPREVRELMND